MRQDDAASRNRFRSTLKSRTPITNVLLPEERFQSMLWRESKRSERSRKRLLLMLIDHGNPCEQPKQCRSLTPAARALGSVIRQTDIAGWFEPNCVLGVIFTEFGNSDVSLAADAIEAKITGSLQQALTMRQLNNVHMSFYSIPDSQSSDGAAAVRHQVMESNTMSNESLVGYPAVLQLPLPSRVAELCSPIRRLRLD